MEIYSGSLEMHDDPGIFIEVWEEDTPTDKVTLSIRNGFAHVDIWGEPSEDVLLRTLGLSILSGGMRDHDRDKLCKSIERATTGN